MIARVVVAFLMLAAVWSIGIPDRVRVGPDRDPEAHGAMATAALDAAQHPRALDLDAAPHRAEIGRIEDVLYRRGPASIGDGAAVENAATSLAQDLFERGGLRANQAGVEVLSFASRVAARGAAGYSLPSLVELRRDWEDVRASVFQRTAWMRTAGPDLDRVQDPPPPAMDPRTDGAIREAEATLRRLLPRGQREAERLGEPVYDPDVPGRDDGGQIQAWYRFGERWRGQLLDAVEPLDGLSPPPDPSRQPLRFEAIRALREAHEMLRRVPDGAGMWPTPFRTAWESRFEAASAALARAREQMAQVDDPGPDAPAHDHARWSR